MTALEAVTPVAATGLFSYAWLLIVVLTFAVAIVLALLGVERVAADACRAHQHVEAPQLCDGRLDPGGVAHVVPIHEVVHVYVGAARSEPLDGRGADPARAARDERDTARQVVDIGHAASLQRFGCVYESPDSERAQSRRVATPEQAANATLDGMEENAYRVLIGRDARLMDLLSG